MMHDELDPVEETRAIREKIMRKYKTTEAYFKHLKTVPTAEVLLAQVRRKNERAGTNRRSAAKPARRGGVAERPVPN